MTQRAESPSNSPDAMQGPSAWVIVSGVLLLFVVWSNSFNAIEYLLDARAPGGASFDWLSLTAARFAPVALICAVYCFVAYPRRTRELLRDHWPRLLVAALFNVTGYNFALYGAQQMGIAAPIASLMTVLAPLFLMLLAALFLGERLTRKRLTGFAIAMAGVVIISQSKEMTGASYPALVALAAVAPLSWAIYSVLMKPLTGKYPPLLITYLVLVLGGGPFCAVLFFDGGGGAEMLAMNAGGWCALVFLSLLSTVLGFGLWMWLLKYIPASIVGFTIFLNPPMTTASKAALTALFPEAFDFTIVTGEVFGGLIALIGVAVAVWKRRRPEPR